MADGVNITAGSGTTIATDDAGAAGQVQIVKLAIGTDGSATSIPADANGILTKGGGTAGSAASAVTTVQGIASMTPILATLSGSNSIVNVSGTVSLPTGAATAAKQPALGTAGSAATDVITIQGIASGTVVPISVASIPSHAVTNAGTFVTQIDGAALTALQLIDNLPNTLGSSTSGQSGALALGAVTTAAPTYTNAQTNALSLDTAGALRVAITSGAGSGGTSIADDASFTTASTSLTPVGGQYKSTRDAVDDNDAGVFAMSPKRAQYVTLETPAAVSAMDETAGAVKVLLVSTAGSALTADTQAQQDVAIASGTIGNATSGLSMVRASAAAPTGVSADDDAVIPWALRNGSQVVNVAAGGTLITNTGTSLNVNPTPATAGGLSTFNATSSDGATALTNTAQSAKGSAGQVFGYYIYNPNATAQFVQFYNTVSGSVTVGSTSPLFMLTVPATSGANLMGSFGITFGTAISISATSTAGGAGAPTTALDAVVWYV